MVLIQEWITILPKVEVGYHCANSPFMSWIVLKEIYDRQLEEPFFYIYVMLSLKSSSHLESLEALFHK